MFKILNLYCLIIFYIQSVIGQIYTPINNNLNNIITYKINNTNSTIRGFIYKFDDANIFNTFKNVCDRGIIIDFICDKDAYSIAKKLDYCGSVYLLDDKSGMYNKLHAKSLLFDDNSLLVGSFNLDKTTFTSNFEIIVEINDTKYINNFINLFEQLKSYLKINTNTNAK